MHTNIITFFYKMFTICLIAMSQAAFAIDFKLLTTSNNTLSEPHDIVLSPNGKSLYVADNGNNQIAVLDSKTLQHNYNFGEDTLSEPHDVVFDKQGRLLVADTGNNRIAIFTINNEKAKLVETISGRIRRPEGVAVHQDGRIFATGSSSGNLVIFKDGKIIGEKTGFSAIHDVELDVNGNIWIADTGHQRIVMLDNKLNILKEISGKEFDFNGPRYLDFHQSGLIFVADKYSHSIKVISPTHKLLKTLGSGKPSKGEGRFDRPEGVELQGDDAWFSDTYNNRIVRYKIIY